MAKEAGDTITVESVSLAPVAAPPPETLAWLTSGDLASAAMLTVAVSGGKLAPGAKTSPRLQPAVGVVWHNQPVPEMEVTVIPTGGVSNTCTTAELRVGPAPVFLTVSEYVP